MRPFLVCIHDATPAWASETTAMIRDLAPLVGRRLSCAVVPDWHGRWPLPAHLGFCRILHENAEELLLHGYSHQRRRGWGPASWLANGGDEMSGLSREETGRALERGQAVFAEVFGERARGFLAPGWQPGHVRRINRAAGLEHVMGFFSLESASGRRVPLATWTWDCGPWSWLAYLGHGAGWLRQAATRGIPTLAMHPADVRRGFWPKILRLTRDLIARGYQPSTPSRVLEAA